MISKIKKKISFLLSVVYLFGAMTASRAAFTVPGDTGLPNPGGGFKAVVEALLNWILAIVGLIAIIGFVISGIQYLTSAGDDDRIETAKKNMTYCIVGVVVALSAYIVVKAVNTVLSGQNRF